MLLSARGALRLSIHRRDRRSNPATTVPRRGGGRRVAGEPGSRPHLCAGLCGGLIVYGALIVAFALGRDYAVHHPHAERCLVGRFGDDAGERSPLRASQDFSRIKTCNKNQP